jgi:hypothetical protein
MADDWIWGLAPQSSPSPICAAYPSSAFSEHWEPRLSIRETSNTQTGGAVNRNETP